MSDEFISYQDTLAELQLSEDELNDLVANGELRGFRDGDEVRFKKEDVTGLKKSRETEPSISCTASSSILPPPKASA